MKITNLTLKDIIDIYHAGYRDGESDASAFYTGTNVGIRYSNLVDVLKDKYTHTPIDQIEKWITDEVSKQTNATNK